MPVRTDAIRAFQSRVHAINNANQRDIRLTAQEARNLSAELAQLTALLTELQSQEPNTTLAVEINSPGF